MDSPDQERLCAFFTEVEHSGEPAQGLLLQCGGQRETLSKVELRWDSTESLCSWAHAVAPPTKKPEWKWISVPLSPAVQKEHKVAWWRDCGTWPCVAGKQGADSPARVAGLGLISRSWTPKFHCSQAVFTDRHAQLPHVVLQALLGTHPQGKGGGTLKWPFLNFQQTLWAMLVPWAMIHWNQQSTEIR